MAPRSDAEFEAERIGSPSRARRIDIRRTLYSFRHAGRGFSWAVSSQANLRVHLVAAALVLVAAVLLRFSALEFVALVLSAALVIGAELFNTTLEVLIDYAWPEHHPMIGRAKDVAAAAVLVTAVGAAIVGVLAAACQHSCARAHRLRLSLVRQELSRLPQIRPLPRHHGHGALDRQQW